MTDEMPTSWWAAQTAAFKRWVVIVAAGVLVLLVASVTMIDDDPADGGGDRRTCLDALETLAERRGGGFVRGVDPEYDPAMDWDGDGVACE